MDLQSYRGTYVFGNSLPPTRASKYGERRPWRTLLHERWTQKIHTLDGEIESVDTCAWMLRFFRVQIKRMRPKVSPWEISILARGYATESCAPWQSAYIYIWTWTTNCDKIFAMDFVVLLMAAYLIYNHIYNQYIFKYIWILYILKRFFYLYIFDL